MSEWISVKDKLPRPYEVVLLLLVHEIFTLKLKSSAKCTGYANFAPWDGDETEEELRKNFFGFTVKHENETLEPFQLENLNLEVTHWMTLPEPPNV